MVIYSMPEFLFFLSYNRLKETKKAILDIQKLSKILSHVTYTYVLPFMQS